MKLEGRVKRAYNAFIAIAENSAYYAALYITYSLHKNLYGEDYLPVWTVGIFLPIGAYVICDGVLRLICNEPLFYKSKNKVKKDGQKEAKKEGIYLEQKVSEKH